MTSSKNKGIKIFVNILEAIFAFIIVLLLIFVLIFASNKPGKSSGGSLFGYETRLVLSDSMNASEEFYEDKDYEIQSFAAGGCIFLNDCDYENESKTIEFYDGLKIGDVVTYNSIDLYHEYITHRIIDIKEEDNDTIYVIQGDNGDSEYAASENIKRSSGIIVGKVIGHSAFVGWLYTNVLANKFVIWILIVTPCLIVASIEIIKIRKELKIQKSIEEKSKDDEIDNLKKEIEELKKTKDKKGGSDDEIKK